MRISFSHLHFFIIAFVFCACAFFIFHPKGVLKVFAADIDGTDKEAEFLNPDHGILNFRPGGETVASIDDDSGDFIGWAWGDVIGLVNLNAEVNCDQDSNGFLDVDCDGDNTTDPVGSFKVNVSCSSGHPAPVTGYAWIVNGGWINFDTAQENVVITEDGEFDGYAWAQNYGWIKFDCGGTACVKTSFQCGGGPTGCVGANCPSTSDVCSNISGNQSSVPSGYYASGGSCYPDTWDVCDNIPGNQDVAPAGYFVNGTSCVLDFCPNLLGGQIAVPGGYFIENGSCVFDLCPNLTGGQSSIPTDFTLEDGACVNLPADMCPNILGVQVLVPDGYTVALDGSCVLPSDVCPNIPDMQTTVPTGYIYSSDGMCIVPPFDACPNISGSQSIVPSGYEQLNNGNCIPTIPPPPEEPDNKTDLVTGVLNGVLNVLQDLHLPVGVTRALGQMKTYLKEDTPMKVLQIVSLSSLAGGTAGLVPSLFRLWNLLLSFFGIRRRHRPWGTVYDSETKQPLDPAYVSLHNPEGAEVASSITDLDGRYGFLVDPGTYSIVASKTHYAFPSQKLAGRDSDELYEDLYFGGPIDIRERGEVIAKNIPMDPVGFDWNEKAKREMKVSNFFDRHDVILIRIIDILFIFGFLTSFVAVIVLPTALNITIFALYVLILAFYILGFHPRSHGIVTNEKGYPLSFAIIRIFHAHLNKEIAHKVTDADGKYFCLVQKGIYYVTIERKNPDGTYTLVFTSKALRANRGVINKNFVVGS